MKKILGIVVLCLMCCSYSFAEDRPGDLDILDYKEWEAIGNKLTSSSRDEASNVCYSRKKFAYQFDSSANARDGKRWRKLRFFCTRELLTTHPLYGNVGWTMAWGVFGNKNTKHNLVNNIILSTYSQELKDKWDSEDNKSNETKSFSGGVKDNIKVQCLEFGFREGSEKFADCQLKLFMMLNSNSSKTENSNQTGSYVIKDKSGKKRKIDPSVWDDLGNISKDLLGGKSVSESLGGVSSSGSSRKITCFKTGEETGGLNKICRYDCVGNLVTTTVGAAQMCPIQIQR